MSLWKIAWRSVSDRRLSSILTCLSMALGIALVVTVLVVYGVIQETFMRSSGGYHMIVGGKNGSKLELVLSTYYHIGIADEPVSWEFYTRFLRSESSGDFGPLVQTAVPICLGDNYKGFRVVATTPAFFDAEESVKIYRFAAGRAFEDDDFFAAVVGSAVAKETGLKVGDTIRPSHGVEEEGSHEHANDFKVVGVLAPTETANDRALYINIEGFYLMEGHAKVKEGDTLSDKQRRLAERHREVTAILVRCPNDESAFRLLSGINEGVEAQAVSPVLVFTQLLSKFLAPVRWLMLGVAALTVLVAGIGVMVSIYNTMAGRRHEIAVMRALGASRQTVMMVVLFESLLLSVGGGLLGILLGHSLVAVIAPWVEMKASVNIGFFDTAPGFTVPIGSYVLKLSWELVLIPGLIVLASIAGYIPGMTAYRTDVAKSLSATP